MDDATDSFDAYSRWLVRDAADGAFLAIGKRARVPHGRTTCLFVPRDKATAFPTPEAAARAVLLVAEDRFSTVEFVQERVERLPGVKVSDVVPPPRTHGVVPSSWLGGLGTMSARDLLDTLRWVEARSVDPMDIPAVAEIFAEVTGGSPTSPGFG